MKISKKSAWTNLSKSLVKNAQLSILSAVVMLFLALSAHGQKLEDFKTCAARPSIANMPYTRIKSAALSLERSKKSAFSAVSGYGFDRMEDEKDAILKKIKTEKGKIEDAEEEVEDDKKRSPELTSPGEKKIKDAKEKLEDLEDDIDDMNKKIDKAIDKFETLQEARKKVREIFEDVNDELDNTLNRPHVHIGPKPSSSDKEATTKYNEKLKQLKAYVHKIGDKFDDEAEEHLRQEKGAGTTVKNLKELKAKTAI